MKTRLVRTALSAAMIASLPLMSFAEGKSIYGQDNRLDYFEAPLQMQYLSLSVVSLWRADKVAVSGNLATLATRDFGTALNLCPGEKFRDQTVGAFCSGALVGEDLIMTAGHCITDQAKCADTKFVFGYRVGTAGAAPTTTVAAGDVYSCSSIVTRFLGSEPGSTLTPGDLGPDYALIKLDRKVTGRQPLPINRAAIARGTGLTVIGHPVGLPLKVAGGASVRDASNPGYFVADLDTFGGNSGSPVFNTSTGKIEGILVRGDTDFLPSPAGCTTMATYEQTGGRGEDVTRVSALSSFIPRLKSEGETEEIAMVDSSSLQVGPWLTRPVSFE